MPLTPTTSFRFPAVFAAFTALAPLAFATTAHADVKQACVDASTEGQSLRDSGKLRQAHDKFVSCAVDECPTIVKKYCKDWLADVDRRMPTVLFRVRSAEGADVEGAALTVDGARLPLDSSTPVGLDPGAHALHATGPNGDVVDERVVLVEGEQGRVVVLRLASASSQPTPPGPPPKDVPPPETSGGAVPPLTIASLVVTGVGVAGFAYFGLKAHGDLSNLRDTCAPFCASSDLSTVKTEALVADIFLGVGVVALGVAAYSFFTRHDAPAAAALIDIRPSVGGASLGLSTSF